MEAPRLLAVPNVSEGRDEAALGRIASALASRAHLLDTHSDPVHNRTVFTLAPHGGGSAAEALLAGAAEAIAEIDMRRHQGEHPCVGAVDVAPVVYLAPDAREVAQTEARAVAEALSALDVPVFLYGSMATSDERRERAFFRGGGIDTLARRLAAGELEPDFGPFELHETAGATLVTARPPLAAFNLELKGVDVEGARALAGEIRESGGGLPGIRAIGLDLGDGRTQLSTNIHDPLSVPLADVVALARELADRAGGAVVGAEIVGLVPRAAMAGFPGDLRLHDGAREWDPGRGQIEDVLAALAR